MDTKLIPLGYMAKRVISRPEWLHAEQVVDIYSVSNCLSNDFANYISFWKHNGYWFFNSREIILQLARENSIDLEDTALFYYEGYDLQYDSNLEKWSHFQPEPVFPTEVVDAANKRLAGYDIVTFSTGTSAECSPLSCNALATEVETNSHCLQASLEQAQRLLESGAFSNSEPGPYRIFAVYSVDWP